MGRGGGGRPTVPPPPGTAFPKLRSREVRVESRSGAPQPFKGSRFEETIALALMVAAAMPRSLPRECQKGKTCMFWAKVRLTETKMTDTHSIDPQKYKLTNHEKNQRRFSSFRVFVSARSLKFFEVEVLGYSRKDFLRARGVLGYASLNGVNARLKRRAFYVRRRRAGRATPGGWAPKAWTFGRSGLWLSNRG